MGEVLGRHVAWCVVHRCALFACRHTAHGAGYGRRCGFVARRCGSAPPPVTMDVSQQLLADADEQKAQVGGWAWQHALSGGGRVCVRRRCMTALCVCVRPGKRVLQGA